MSGWLADETSVEDSVPLEGYEIVLPAVTYRLASGIQDVIIGGFRYTASPIARTEIGVPCIEAAEDITMLLPVSHQFAQRYLANGTPPKRIIVQVWRQQKRSGQAEAVWRGAVTQLDCEGDVAKFTVAAVTGEHGQRLLPTVTVGRLCPHILYDAMCRLNAEDFKITATVSSISGRVATVSTIDGHADGHFARGNFRHLTSGEEMLIVSQVGTAITLQFPIVGMEVGDSVELFAGCALDVITCHVKFNNKVNHGGFPQLPRGNPFVSNGFGIYQSESE